MASNLFQEEPTLGVKPIDQGQATPTGIDPATGVMPGDTVNASPEEQAAYENIINKAQQVLMSDKTSKLFLDKMNQPNKPVHEVVGESAALLGRMIMGSMERAGIEVDVVTVLQAAEDFVIPALFRIGEQEGVLPDLEGEAYTKENHLAMFHAEKVYGDWAKSQGKLPTTDAQAALEEEFARDGQGYTLDQFFKDAGHENIKQDPLSAGVQQANSQIGGQPMPDNGGGLPFPGAV